ncbi:hypothetical protein EJ06DRAFT_531566 [Trichodelitschia bisporula]|uniref:Mannosyltransferase n=1 Tax=Trichodelitschia bisporula TaxID=703511 RepID=A0A6G1HTA0_9PEZI|nr:hypothetical protein EJ06DRAFT_531566 [Trichodelitschia bisporula]
MTSYNPSHTSPASSTGAVASSSSLRSSAASLSSASLTDRRNAHRLRNPSSLPAPQAPSPSPPTLPTFHYLPALSSSLHVLLLLFALRIFNALTLKTFFQPDEFFQSLEPAWQLAFGEDSGAWITWEWKNQLRSSLHPLLFAGVYHTAALLSAVCRLSPALRSSLLLAAPKVTQALFATALDYFTWRWVQSIYGPRSRAAWASLALTTLSPWQWFCSTRTLSNCLEASLTAAALLFWPWHWISSRKAGHFDQSARGPRSGEISRLRLSLSLAAVATIFRPTNVLVWLPIALQTLRKTSVQRRVSLIREAIVCGSIVLACTTIVDRIFFGMWAFPPLRFVYFNITKSLAVFYGSNRPDYYFTEGLPLLLTTALPFAAIGLFKGMQSALVKGKDSVVQEVQATATWTILFVVGSLSLISHKEARFLYPLLPLLHLLASPSLAYSTSSRPLGWLKRIAVIGFVSINVAIAAYTSLVHQRGVIDVLHELRSRYELRERGGDFTVAFLMPCHSTPWRSHLIHKGIDAWALTCEPPLDVPLDQRHTYLDEADQFYAHPPAWLAMHMEDLPALTSGASGGASSGADGLRGRRAVGRDGLEERDEGARMAWPRRAWPQYLAFFEQLEPTMKTVLQSTPYRECWRTFNSHWHDDWRRRGDVIVWCLEEA